MRKQDIIDVSPVRKEVVSPEEFLRLTKESPHLIAKSRFISPAIGRRDFGRFEVVYSVPILKRAIVG